MTQRQIGSNVIIFVTDDQRSLLEFMPNVAAHFLDGGRRFPNAMVVNPLCCPSRASIMSGKYSHNTGMLGNVNPPPRLQNFAAGEDTLQRYLHRAGYRTGLYGKFLNGWPSLEPGAGKNPPHFDRFATIDIPARYVDGGYWVGSRAAPAHHVDSKGYYTHFITSEVIDFLEACDQRHPFYLYVAYKGPHSPYVAEDRYADLEVTPTPRNPATQQRDRSDKPPAVREAVANYSRGQALRARQARTLPSVDDSIGAILQHLRARGQLDNTIRFFVSDHGTMWGEHGLLHKDWPYLQDLRIPLLAAGPGFEPGTVDSRLVANIDIAPTVVNHLGLNQDFPMDGRSLLDESWGRKRLLSEHWCNVDRCLFWSAYTSKKDQFTNWYTDASKGHVAFREYYDLEADPWQLVNRLHTAHPDNNLDVAALEAKLLSLQSCSGPSCWAAEDAPLS